MRVVGRLYRWARDCCTRGLSFCIIACGLRGYLVHLCGKLVSRPSLLGQVLFGILKGHEVLHVVHVDEL